VLSGRGLCDELITRAEESYRLCCVVMCDLETSRMGAPYIYIYGISRLRVKRWKPMSKRPIGRPKLRWADDVLEDIKIMNVRNWKNCSTEQR